MKLFSQCKIIQSKLPEIISFEEFHRLTFADLNKSLSEVEFPLVSFLLVDDGNWYCPEEIVEFLMNKEKERDEEIAKELISFLEDYEKWTELKQVKEKELASLENVECRRYVSELLEILKEEISVDENNLERWLAVLKRKQEALERRIPVPETLIKLEAEIERIQELKDAKDEYEKRLNRKDNVTEEPIITVNTSASPILQVEEDLMRKYLNKIGDNTYSMISLVGATGSGKSLILRSSLSSLNPFAPSSNFGMSGTTRDIRYFATSEKELQGSPLPGGSKITLIDTEGSKALVLSDMSEHIDDKETNARNCCLQSVFPLVYFISTVIIYTVSSIEVLRTHDTKEEIASFAKSIQGAVTNNFLLPALLIAVNRFDDEADLQTVKDGYNSFLRNEFQAFLFVEFVTIPKLKQKPESKELVLSVENIAKLKQFYQKIASTVQSVNEFRSSRPFQAALSLNRNSYMPLVSLVCSSLPDPVDLKRFWRKQILKSEIFRGAKREVPSVKCFQFADRYEKFISLHTPLQMVYQGYLENIAELFRYHWILKIIESEKHNKSFDFQIADRQGLWSNDYAKLCFKMAFFAPCQYHQIIEGKYYFCKQTKEHAHHTLLKERSKIRSIFGRFYTEQIKVDAMNPITAKSLPSLGNLQDTVDLYLRVAQFDFQKFFHKFFLLAIPRDTVPPYNWRKNKKTEEDTIEKQKALHKNGICWICQNRQVEIVLPCGLPHFMCLPCYDYYTTYICNEECKFCPFCTMDYSDPKTRFQSEPMKIFHFLHQVKAPDGKYSTMFRKSEFLSILRPTEESVAIISVIGKVKSEQVAAWKESIGQTLSPIAFVNFIRCAALINSSCIFYDGQFMIIYYCSDHELSKTQINSMSELTSSITIDLWNNQLQNTSDPEAAGADNKLIKRLWDYFFHYYDNLGLRNIAKPANTVEKADILAQLDMFGKVENRILSKPMWGSLMGDFTASGKYPFTVIEKVMRIDQFTQVLTKTYFIKRKYISVIRDYQSKMVYLVIMQLFTVPEFSELISLAQKSQGTMLLAKKLVHKIWKGEGEIKYLTEIIKNIGEIVTTTPEFQQKDSMKAIALFRLLSILHFIDALQYGKEQGRASLSDFDNKLKSLFSPANLNPAQAVCYLCFTAVESKFFGCGKHHLCENCWENGFLSLLDNGADTSTCTEPATTENTLINQILKLLPRGNLFSCLVCKKPLLHCFWKYVCQNERQSMPLFNFFQSILASIQTNSFFPRISPVGSKQKGTKFRLESAISQNNINFEMHHAFLVSTDAAISECLVKKVEGMDESRQELARKVSIHSLASGLPCFQECYGSDFVATEKVCHIAYKLAKKTLQDVFLHEKLTTDQALTICFDVARGLRLLHLMGDIHRDLKPANIAISESEDGIHAHIFDFGNTKIPTGAKQAPYYKAPEIKKTCNHTEKIDQYSFGLLLVEIFMHLDNPQRLRDFYLLEEMDHLSEFQQLLISLSDSWEKIALLIVTLLDTNPEKRPSFGECMNTINDVFYILSGKKIMDLLFEDECNVQLSHEIQHLNNRYFRDKKIIWFVFFFFSFFHRLFFIFCCL